MTKMVPVVRFNGFDDAWEERKLGEIANSFEYGLNAPAKEFDGIHKYIRITDINDSSRKFNNESVTSPDIDFSFADNYKLKKDDILFARTGASVGKSYIYTNSDGLVYFAGFLIRARIKPEFDSNFVFQNTLTNSYENFIRVTSQRSGQPGVNAKEYSTFEINVPSFDEQTKIGSLFQKIDSQILLQQAQLDQQREFKKAMLQKMFPRKGAKEPEIRFNGFSGEWEEKKLDKLARVSTGFPFSSENFSEEGLYEVVTNSHIQENYRNVLENIGSRINVDNTDSLVKFILNHQEILVTMDGTVGRAAMIHSSHKILAQRVGRIVSNHQPYFLYTWMTNGLFSKVMLKNSNGGTIKHITLDDIRNYSSLVPPLEEQTKIGNFFKALDDYIETLEQQLEQTKTMKQALLQKMFI